MVCDAGGGTVDLASYRIESALPPATMEEVAAGSGDWCGAVNVDNASVLALLPRSS